MSSFLPPKTSGGVGGDDVAAADWSVGVVEFLGTETLKRRRWGRREAVVVVRRGMELRKGERRRGRGGAEVGERRAEEFMAPPVVTTTSFRDLGGVSRV